MHDDDFASFEAFEAVSIAVAQIRAGAPAEAERTLIAAFPEADLEANAHEGRARMLAQVAG